MVVDFSISIGNILTILTFIVGGISFAATIKIRVDVIATRFDTVERQIEKIGDIMLAQGVQQERMNGIDARFNLLSSRVDLLFERIERKITQAL